MSNTINIPTITTGTTTIMSTNTRSATATSAAAAISGDTYQPTSASIVNNRRHSSRRNRNRSSAHRHHSRHSSSNHFTIHSFTPNNTTTTTNTNTASTRDTSAASGTTGGLRLLFSSGISSQKKTERNLMSATCSIFCIAILAVSLIEIRWFYLNGGGCNVNYLGAAHFFSPGRLQYQIEMSKVTKSEIRVYTFILSNGIELRNCANREIMLIMRTCIAFVFLAIFSSCCGLMLDTFGSMRPGVRLLRRNAVFHIVTVVFCLVVNGFCFWMSEKMNEQQIETRTKKGKKIEISFDVSYYLIVIAGGLSIVATAFTLIRRYPSDEDEQLERLLEEYTGFEEPIHLERSLPAPNTTSTIVNQSLSIMPPPPPSTPPPSLSNPQMGRESNTNSRIMVEPPPPYNVDTSLLA